MTHYFWHYSSKREGSHFSLSGPRTKAICSEQFKSCLRWCSKKIRKGVFKNLGSIFWRQTGKPIGLGYQIGRWNTGSDRISQHKIATLNNSGGL